MGSRREPFGLVGRRGELDALSRVVAAASEDGHASVALVEGEAGIGKSRLVAEVAADAERRGLTVLIGRAHDLERDRPFGPVADALGLRPGGAGPEQAEIAGLLDADAAAPAASPLLDQAPELRYRLLEAVLASLERLAATGPVVLTLEDLHWADASTLLVVHHVVRRLRDLPIALLLTLRPSPRLPELDRLVDELAAQQAVYLPLAGLDANAVAALVEQSLGAPPGPGLRTQVDRAGGNPLFVTELVAALRQEQAITVVEGAAETSGSTVPPSLRLTILRRLSFLPEASLDVLRVAAVLGDSFSLTDLSVLLARPSPNLLSALREPLRARLIEDAGERLAFRHALVRDAIYADLPLSARRALHLQAARSLAAAGRAHAQVARHFLLGAEHGDTEAVTWLHQAGRQTVGRAPAVAVELYEAALRVAGDVGPAADTLAAELGVALMWAGRVSDGEARLRGVLERHHDPELEVPARMALAQALLLQGRAGAAAELLDAATQHEDAHPQLLAMAALARLARGDVDTADAGAERARVAGLRRGDDLAVCLSLSVQAAVTGLRGHVAAALELGRQAMDLAAASPSREASRHPPQFFLVGLLLESDQLEEAQRMLQTARRVGEHLGMVWDLPLYHLLSGWVYFHAADHDQAVAEVESALALTEEVGTRVNVVWAHALLAHVRLQRGDLEATRAAVEAGEREMAAVGVQVRGADWLVWARALLEDAAGRGDVALLLMRAVWDAHAERGIVAERAMFGPDLVRVCLAQGDREAAVVVAAAVGEAAELNPAASARGAALRCRGLATDDPDALLAAVDCYRTTGRRMEYALACEDAGVALSRGGRPEQARALLREALAVYEPRAALRPLRRAEAALRAAGGRAGKRGTRGRPATGWDALTDTELQVTRLATAGLTNPEIGERLFISRRTVETHLSHVFTKLGLTSRVELAAAVTERP